MQFFFLCPSNSVLSHFNLFVSFLVFFFLNTNIVVDYIIGKAGNELVSFFLILCTKMIDVRRGICKML